MYTFLSFWTFETSKVLQYQPIPPGKNPVQLALSGLYVPSILQSCGRFSDLHLASIASKLAPSFTSERINFQSLLNKTAFPNLGFASNLKVRSINTTRPHTNFVFIISFIFIIDLFLSALF